jgi:N-methylhydantoinase B
MDIKAEKGSILNAEYPSAVVGGNVETSQRVVDMVFGALSKVIPEMVPAASAGTMSNTTFGGENPANGKNFAYYETIAGGMGGRFGKDGVSAVQTHMTNTLNTPIEALERELPVMIDSYSVRKRSGGRGRFKGGDGIVRKYRFLTDATVSLITERRKSAPYGIQGGERGKKGRNILLRKGKASVIPSKATFTVKRGDVLEIRTPGGGGWGKPKNV